jgi:hypothetical protein
MKESAKFVSRMPPGAQEEDFEAAWPNLWTRSQFHADAGASPSAFALLATGLVAAHPLRKPCLVGSQDFTGEGPEDLHGHGTICALHCRLACPFKVQSFNSKVAGADGRGASTKLIAGLRWLGQLKHQPPVARLTANLSVGVYSRRYLGVVHCRGDCAVCQAAIGAVEEGMALTVAAGNPPGLTACPAKAGRLTQHAGMLAVGASAYEQRGIGTYSTPGHIPGYRPLELDLPGERAAAPGAASDRGRPWGDASFVADSAAPAGELDRSAALEFRKLSMH